MAAIVPASGNEKGPAVASLSPSPLPHLLQRRSCAVSAGKPSLIAISPFEKGDASLAGCARKRRASRQALLSHQTGAERGADRHRPPLPQSPIAARAPGAKLPFTPPLSPAGIPSTPQQHRARSVDAHRCQLPLVPGMPSPAGPASSKRPSLVQKALAPASSANVAIGKFSWEAAHWPKSGASSKVIVSVAQDANEDCRPYMEDGLKVVDPLPVHGQLSSRAASERALDEQWRFFAVYDGHGGRHVMDWLETHLHQFVAAELQTLRTPGSGHIELTSVTAAVTKAFKKADAELASLGAWKCGSTATVALIHDSAAGKVLYVANVGDSRAVLVGGPVAKQVSVDHHATNKSEVERIEGSGGCIFRKRVYGVLSVTRAFGDHELKSGGVSCVPDVSSHRVHGAKAVVVASDGVWDVLDGADVQEILEDCICNAMEKKTPPEFVGDILQKTAAQAIVACAKERGSHDNICALVAFL